MRPSGYSETHTTHGGNRQGHIHHYFYESNQRPSDCRYFYNQRRRTKCITYK